MQKIGTEKPFAGTITVCLQVASPPSMSSVVETPGGKGKAVSVPTTSVPAAVVVEMRPAGQHGDVVVVVLVVTVVVVVDVVAVVEVVVGAVVVVVEAAEVLVVEAAVVLVVEAAVVLVVDAAVVLVVDAAVVLVVDAAVVLVVDAAVVLVVPGLVVLVVGGAVVVDVPGQPPPAEHASQQLEAAPTQALPPFGGRQRSALRLMLQRVLPAASVRQQVTKPSRPHVECAAQLTTSPLHSARSAPSWTASLATCETQET
jgi:hypothetical protein